MPLVPELRLHLADAAVPVWHATEKALAAGDLPPPFWAFAWVGGQALARYVFDRPECVAGKRVLDLASGSGIVAIAAMKAGAASAIAADIDPFAQAAIRANAGRTSATRSARTISTGPVNSRVGAPSRPSSHSTNGASPHSTALADVMPAA